MARFSSVLYTSREFSFSRRGEIFFAFPASEKEIQKEKKGKEKEGERGKRERREEKEGKRRKKERKKEREEERVRERK